MAYGYQHQLCQAIMDYLKYHKCYCPALTSHFSLLLHLCIIMINIRSPLAISITMTYPDAYNPSNQINVNMYVNGIINGNFTASQYQFECSSSNVFTMVQQATPNNNKPYYMQISNISSMVTGTVQSYFSNPSTTPSAFTCQPSQTCTVTLTNNCESIKDYNTVTISINLPDTTLKIEYNYICNGNYYSSHNMPEWGALIIVVFSIFMIVVAAYFQQARSINNLTLYFNVPIILTLNAISIIQFVVVGLQLPNIANIILYICYALSILFTIPAFTLSIAQIIYVVTGQAVLGPRISYVRIVCVCASGIILASGALVGLYYSHFNWIVSDLIFLVIFISIIKIVKFGSLKISLFAFCLSLTLSISFIILTELITKAYLETSYFGNPLFLACPNIIKIPNQSCSWYFILAMAYPGMFLAFLHRFDKNKAAHIYAPTFIVTYAICSLAWFVVGTLIKPPLPYDLFTVPISMLFLVLFANRRGQLRDLWQGRFYDEQKGYLQNQKSIIQHLADKKPGNSIDLQKQLFHNLKYGDRSEDAYSNSSKFSQIIKGLDRQQITELRYIYSQGEEKHPQNKALERDPLSNQTQRVSGLKPSQFSSGKWTLSKIS